MTEPTWTVDTPSAAWEADRKKRELVELILAGTEAVRGNCGDGSRSDGILRRETGEDQAAFDRRRDQSELVNFLRGMIEDHTNRIFRRPPAFGADVPVEIKGSESSRLLAIVRDLEAELSAWPPGDLHVKAEELLATLKGKAAELRISEVKANALVTGWAENIDNAETSWDVFCRGNYEAAKRAGGVGVLVDMPPAPEGERTLEDKAASGRRPYCVRVTADAAIEMSPRTVRGVQRLGSLRYRECVTTKTAPYDPGTEVKFVREYHDGLDDFEATRLNPGVPDDHPAFFGADPADLRFMVLDLADPRRLASFKVWRVSEKEDVAAELEDSGDMKPFRRIPFVWVQINEGDKYRADPPEETTAVAKTTREHFRKKSAIDSYMRRSCMAVLYRQNHEPEVAAATGGAQNQLSTHNFFSDPPGTNADMKFVEPEGKSLTHLRADLNEIEARAKEQSNEPLLPNRGNLTATEADLRNRKANSKLEGQVLRLCDGHEQVLDLMMQWTGLPPGSGGSLVPDFQDLSTAPPDTAFADVVGLHKEGLIPGRKLLEEAKRFRRISEDSDPDGLLQDAAAEKAKTPEAQVLTALTAARLGDRTSSFVSEETYLKRLAEFGVLPSDLNAGEEIKRLAEERAASASEGGLTPVSAPIVDKGKMPVVAM